MGSHGWELETAYMMRRGASLLIGYSWVPRSIFSGAGDRRRTLVAVHLGFVSNAASDPVDLEFIGHRRTLDPVVNTYAIVKLEGKMTPQLKSGYIEDILLDPHAANILYAAMSETSSNCWKFPSARELVRENRRNSQNRCRCFSGRRRSGVAASPT